MGGGVRFLDEIISLGGVTQPRAFQGSSHDVRFYISTAVTIKEVVCWDVTLSGSCEN
jgi:hypothetical protein